MDDSVDGQSVKQFLIPDYILVPGTDAHTTPYTPECPVVVFINSKSGGQLGGDLLTTCCGLLNKTQVFDLGEHAPDKVLHMLYGHLEKLRACGDKLAEEIEKKLRLIVAGGDGTAGWLLGVVSDLKLSRPPPIATLPLGTGNNLPFSFGWILAHDAELLEYYLGGKNLGFHFPDKPIHDCYVYDFNSGDLVDMYGMGEKQEMYFFSERKPVIACGSRPNRTIGKKNPGTDRLSVMSFLLQVKKAKEMEIDSWHILMRMKAPKEGTCDPIAPLELPHSLHAFHRVSSNDSLNQANIHSDHKMFFTSCEREDLKIWLMPKQMISSAQQNQPCARDYFCKCSSSTLRGPKFTSLLLKEMSSIIPEGCHTFRGGFWNYFSMGMDAQVSYAFHSERKLHPEKFKNQLMNQTTYAKLGCTQGWFFASLVHPSSRNIAQLAKVKIMKKHGQWQELVIPRSIRSIVCLNLPSFSGGFNPWGSPNQRKERDRDLTEPFVDDGLLEVVGFRDAWHGLVLLAPKGHGTRLAQAHRIRFEFHKGAADCTFMRIDGEPWKQPLPVDDETVVVEISHLGQVKILATEDHKSQSYKNPRPSSSMGNDDEVDGESSCEDNSEEDFEEKRKFGAADTFRVTDEVDISQLS